MRRFFFTAYGICFGLGLAAFVFVTGRDEPLLPMLIFCAVIVLSYGGLGWGAGDPNEFSTLLGLLWVPFFPVFMTYSVVVALGLGVFLVVSSPFREHESRKRERLFQERMKAKDRFVSLDEIRPKLAAGEGTLIREADFFGPDRIWWTQDDLLSMGEPPRTYEDLKSIVLGQVQHAFNERCLREYVDEETGTALLVPIPRRKTGTDSLAKMFPAMKIVSCIRPLREPQASDDDRAVE